MTRGESISEVDKIKDASVNLLQRVDLKLHTWHSNVKALQTNDSVNENELKLCQTLTWNKTKRNKILGLLWDKRECSFIIKYQILTKMPQSKIYLVHWPQSMTH